MRPRTETAPLPRSIGHFAPFALVALLFAAPALAQGPPGDAPAAPEKPAKGEPGVQPAAETPAALDPGTGRPALLQPADAQKMRELAKKRKINVPAYMFKKDGTPNLADAAGSETGLDRKRLNKLRALSQGGARIGPRFTPPPRDGSIGDWAVYFNDTAKRSTQ